MSGTLTRVVTAAVLIPTVVAAVWWGSTGLVAALTGLVTLLALLEFFALAARAGLYGYRIWTCICALALLAAQWELSREPILSWPHISLSSASLSFPASFLWLNEIVFLVFVLGTAVLSLVNRRPITEASSTIGIGTAGLLFVAYPFSFLVRLDGAVGNGKLLLFVLVLVWAGDTLAYFIGRALGRNLMTPLLSPKKTWEGAAANLLGSLLVALIFARWMTIGLGHLLMMALLGNIAGQVGDLLESAYKRSACVKDSGVIIPGHGGVLDRIDALILAAPVVWYYFELALSGRA